MSESSVMKGAGPFYFEGNKIGVILLHGGGGGTAADLKPLAEDLHNRGGYTIRVPLLPGYGTTPKNLRSTSVEEWITFVGEEISSLKEKCDTLFVGGHSMGALLTLISASKYDLKGIFTISAPTGLQGFIHKLVPIFKYFIKYYSVDSEEFKQETNGRWVGYDKIPINIAPKIKTLITMMKDSLGDVKTPILLFQGRLDSVIKKESMETIYNQINSKNKKSIFLEHSDHPILGIPDYGLLISEIMAFINNPI
ncbi:MAG: alpha/beta fold hydrolase [Promethearchaeota archaeon]|nr:MAG: alpha/beta fold hydrolase [Candidatus Lokiarchaeota archaeon]